MTVCGIKVGMWKGVSMYKLQKEHSGDGVSSKTRSFLLKLDSHVPENFGKIFAKLKFSSVLFEKIPSFDCLVFKNKK